MCTAWTPAATCAWQQRLGLAVNDMAVADGLIFAGTEDGDVHALDPAGKVLWSRSLGAPVTKLAALTAAGHPIIVAGLADGRLIALPAW